MSVYTAATAAITGDFDVWDDIVNRLDWAIEQVQAMESYVELCEQGAFHDRQAELLAELEQAKAEVWRSLEIYQKALEII